MVDFIGILASLRRDIGLALEIVVTLVLGLIAAVSTYALMHILSADPLPARSSVLYVPQMESRRTATEGNHAPEQLTFTDAENLLYAAAGGARAMMVGGTVTIERSQLGLPPLPTSARYTTFQFFQLFGIPFLGGEAWSDADDRARGRVVVISKWLNEHLFGKQSGVGRTILIHGEPFRITGVLNDWRPAPRFYDLSGGAFKYAEDVYLPISTARDLKLSLQGSVDCWNGEPTTVDLESSECTWIQFWVELSNQLEAENYTDFLDNYVAEQQQTGRFSPVATAKLYTLMDWVRHKRVVPNEVRVQAIVALVFLVVCVVNAASLLLVKVTANGRTYAIRRALGATRSELSAQCIAEAMVLGALGGVLAIGGVQFSFWIIRRQPWQYAALVELTPGWALFTLAIGVISAIAASLLPAYRACRTRASIALNAEY